MNIAATRFSPYLNVAIKRFDPPFYPYNVPPSRPVMKDAPVTCPKKPTGAAADFEHSNSPRLRTAALLKKILVASNGWLATAGYFICCAVMALAVYAFVVLMCCL